MPHASRGTERGTILYVFLGAACGYVLGGVFGRLTLEAVTGMERELRRRPAAQIAGGIVGLVIGLVIAALMALPLLFLPLSFGWPAVLFLFIVLGFARYPARPGQARRHLRARRHEAARQRARLG